MNESIPHAATPPVAPPAMTRRSRKTRLALVEAARTLLEEQGVAALTVKAVTDRADVGHGTFYHHFASTEAVLAAGIEASMREFAEAMARDFSDADDKAWVFVASLSNTFGMLVAHPALPWMLERTHLLAGAIRDACGPSARRDVEAMLAAGDVRAAAARSGRYWEWIIVGALVHAAAKPRERRSIQSGLVELTLRTLGFDDGRIEGLLARLESEAAQALRKRSRKA